MYDLRYCLMLLARNEKESLNHIPGSEGSEGTQSVSEDGVSGWPAESTMVEMEGPI
jgi:hypothetical protein